MKNSLITELRAAVRQGFAFVNDAADNAQLKAYALRAQKAIDRATEIQASAADEGRDLAADELNELNELNAKAEQAMNNHDALSRTLSLSARLDRPAPSASDAGGVEFQSSRIELPGQTRGNRGFRNLGEFGQQVFKACRVQQGGGGSVDPRLAMVTDGANTETGSEGGFGVPPDFREPIIQTVMHEDSLFSRTDSYPTARNKIEFPKDTGTPWATTGIQARWTGELQQLTQDKPVLADHIIPLHKITALAPISDELLEDAPLMSAYLERKAPEVIAYRTEEALLIGDAADRPVGALASGAAIEVAAEGGQAAGTIEFANVLKMYARLPARYRQGAAWQCRQDALPQLVGLSFPGDNSPVFLPAGGVSARPFDTLFGLPIIYTEAAPELGAAGDLSLVGWRQYSTGYKSTGVKQDVSMHLFFDFDATAFRFVLRIGGKNWLDAPYAARTGSQTYSNVIKLAARA